MEANVKRLLVTGIETSIGGNLALTLADRCEVLGLYDRAPLVPAGRALPWPDEDPQALAALVDDWQPQWIVHCGPLSAASWDAPPDEERALREPRRVESLWDLAQCYGARMTVLSSDAVFAGPRMFHEEDAPVASSAPVASWTRAMERIVENSEALLVRSHAYGLNCDGQAGFAEQALTALTRRESLSASGRRHATPILASDLAELLWRAYELRLHGLYHLAGAERTSQHRFVTELAEILGVETLDACRQPTEETSSICETSLSSKRARRVLGMATPALGEGLLRFVEQAQSQTLPGGIELAAAAA
jgi:dTDP-4-dehydrorhamnose reductase